MRNIRAFFNKVYDIEISDEEYYVEEEHCLDHICNKLLTMDSTNKKSFCRMIVDHLFYNLGCMEDFNKTFTGKDMEHFRDRVDNASEGTKYLASFLLQLSAILLFCDIKLNDICVECDHPILLPDEYSKNIYEKLYFREDLKRKNKKSAGAKTTQQVDVVRTLLRSAGVEYNNDVKLSEFIEWLCGGSADSIRKNGIVPNTGYENEEVLKEKFLNIGIRYDRGRVTQQNT